MPDREENRMKKKIKGRAPLRSTKQKKPETLSQVIRRATASALTKMEEPESATINGWKGASLATWITAEIIVAVNRHLSRKAGA